MSTESETAGMRPTAKIMPIHFVAGPSTAWYSAINHGRCPEGLAEGRRLTARGLQALAGRVVAAKSDLSRGAATAATAAIEVKEGGAQVLADGRPVRTSHGRVEALGKGTATSSNGPKREDAGRAAAGGRYVEVSVGRLPFEVSSSDAPGPTAISIRLSKAAVCETSGRSAKRETTITVRVRVLGTLALGRGGKVPVCPVASRPIMPVCRS